MIPMKRILTAFLLSIFLISNAYSQPVESETTEHFQLQKGQDYAMLIRNMNHLNAALKTVEMMEGDARAVDHFEVVICGKIVTELNDHTDLIDRATGSGITLSVCGMSLNKFSVEKDELPQGIGVVPNGLIRMFDLQEKGYKTIAL